MSVKLPVGDTFGYTSVDVINFTFVWTIDKFTELAEIHPKDKPITSGRFSSPEDMRTEWYLEIHPKGKKQLKLEAEDVSVNLNLSKCVDKELKTFATICIINELGNKTKEISKNECLKGEECFISRISWDKFLPRDKIKECLVNDKLTIFCEIRYNGEEKTIITRIPKNIFFRPKTLNECFETLYDTKNYSDLIIEVNGHEIRAHKLILRARSQVFYKMFEHSMKESKDNKVVIQDIKKEVVEEMLRYCYTGNINPKGIDCKDIFKAAEKYDLQELKHICEEMIISELTIDSVADVLILADSHLAKELKSIALHFYKNNAKAVMASKGWEEVVRNANLLSECLTAVVGFGESKEVSEISLKDLKEEETEGETEN